MSTGRIVHVLLLGLLVVACGTQPPALVEYRVPGTGTSTTSQSRAAAVAGAQSMAPLPWQGGGEITKTALPPAETQGRTPKTALPPPEPQESPARLATAAAPTSAIPASVIVRRGDTVYAVARLYNLPVRGVIDANRLSPPYRLLVGQRLTLPRERIHVVRKGDTVYGIAQLYGTDTGVLTRANELAPPYRLTVGQRLRVPPSAINELIAETAALDVSGVARKAPRTTEDATAGGAKLTAVSRSSPTVIPDPPPRSKGLFLWPVNGKVMSNFGAKGNGLHNDGVNIEAHQGDAVRAAEDGVVVYTGNELRGYGNLVLIRHSGGWTTAYAHNDSILVGRGDTVRRGQIIAHVGATGSVSTPQSHFELRQGSRAVDPLKYLARN